MKRAILTTIVLPLAVIALFAVASCGKKDGKTEEVSAGTPPATPANILATSGINQATVTWNAVSAATSYNVYWSTTAGVAKTNGTKMTSSATTLHHTGLAGGATYFYVVTAVNGNGESADSTQASATLTPPMAPASVAAAGNGALGVDVTWTSTANAASYNLYWSLSATMTKTSGTKISSATSPYIHEKLADGVTALTNGTTYYYLVTAVNGNGESAESSVVSAMATNTPPPPAP